MLQRVIPYLTASIILGHAVFGCCLPHAHADEMGEPTVLGSETHCPQHDAHSDHGTHHTHLDGDSCTFLIPAKVQCPPSEQAGSWVPVLPENASPNPGAMYRAVQTAELSGSGRPPTLTVRDVTQIWLL